MNASVGGNVRHCILVCAKLLHAVEKVQILSGVNTLHVHDSNPNSPRAVEKIHILPCANAKRMYIRAMTNMDCIYEFVKCAHLTRHV